MRGYYSLIQFCPDFSRLETVNVGVVLLCPDAAFIKARTSSNNDRCRRVFGSNAVDGSRLNSAKAAIEARLRKDAAALRSLDELKQFIATRANSLVLTPPRSIKVASPTDELHRLFKELVGAEEGEEQRFEDAMKKKVVVRTVNEREPVLIVRGRRGMSCTANTGTWFIEVDCGCRRPVKCMARMGRG
jgi:hypothetical protein